MAGPGDAMTTSSSSTTTHDNNNGNEKRKPTFNEQLQTFDFRGDAIDMALRYSSLLLLSFVLFFFENR